MTIGHWRSYNNIIRRTASGGQTNVTQKQREVSEDGLHIIIIIIISCTDLCCYRVTRASRLVSCRAGDGRPTGEIRENRRRTRWKGDFMWSKGVECPKPVSYILYTYRGTFKTLIFLEKRFSVPPLLKPIHEFRYNYDLINIWSIICWYFKIYNDPQRTISIRSMTNIRFGFQTTILFLLSTQHIIHFDIYIPIVDHWQLYMFWPNLLLNQTPHFHFTSARLHTILTISIK